MCKQFRVCRWDQSVWKWQPETSWTQTGGYRHRVQRILFVHHSRWRRPHRQLGGRWKRIPGHWWPPPNPTTHARTRRQDARRPQSGRSSVNNIQTRSFSLSFNRMYITVIMFLQYFPSSSFISRKIQLLLYLMQWYWTHFTDSYRISTYPNLSANGNINTILIQSYYTSQQMF